MSVVRHTRHSPTFAVDVGLPVWSMEKAADGEWDVTHCPMFLFKWRGPTDICDEVS